MMRHEILREMVTVAEALERPGLTSEQSKRGWARYNDLETKLAALNAAEKAAPPKPPQEYSEDSEESENEPQSVPDDPRERAAQYVRRILAPEAKKRGKK
ncbi:hypothetical protein ACFSR7_35825 [Cohnella sp. GCM10020058]|uniref:hypothetical protein n=1 Tax=Cohnella sp. GCM10020058 TaxID=3317330 RepID=UPI0036311B96